MFKKFAILLAVVPVAAAAQNISGAMVFYSGTLTSSITGGPSPQSVTLNLTGGSKTFPGTLVTGSTLFNAGSPFTVVAIHSTPFAATFSGTSVIALPTDFTGVAGRRTITMGTNGTIGSYVGISTIDGNALSLLYPPFTIGSMSFRNGMEANIGVPLPTSPLTGNVLTYSIPLPTTSTTTFGTVNFPSPSPTATFFTFNAFGTAIMQVTGTGTILGLPISGNYQGPGTIFTTASLTIETNGQ